MYPMRFVANNASEEDKSGTVTLKVEGEEYSYPVADFATAQRMTDMLESAFKSGKVFAATAMRSHVEQSLNHAERMHGLVDV